MGSARVGNAAADLSVTRPAMSDFSALPNWLAVFAMLPLLGAGLGLALGPIALRPGLHAQNAIAMVAGLANLALAVGLLLYTAQGETLVLHVGARQGPFGIVLVADVFAAIMLAVTALIYVASIPYAMDLLDDRSRMGYFPLSLFLLMGVNGAFLAGDLFNLYVFYEILVISSFVLLSLGGQADQIRGGMRFVVLNLLSSMIFLGGIAITYGVFGTLNLAHLASLLAQDAAPPWVVPVLAGLLFVAFGSKSALFPLHFWLPCSYYTTHPAVNALFGGLLTKVGLYTLMRIYPLLFPQVLMQWHLLFMLVAGASIAVGTLGALACQTIRRVLSFQIVSHVGFIFVGLALAGTGTLSPELCFAAAIVYLVHHMIVKTALLMASGIVEHEFQSGRIHAGVRGNRGLLAHKTGLGIWFFLAAIALAGIPPFSGFLGKLGIFQLLVSDRQWGLMAVAVASSVLTLTVIVRLWQSFFWGRFRPQTRTQAALRAPGLLSLSPVGSLVACSLLIGLFGQQLWTLSARAAEQLHDRQAYIQQAGLAETLSAEDH